MALTALMFVVLMICFALMFALVKFTEHVIAADDSPPQAFPTPSKHRDQTLS